MWLVFDFECFMWWVSLLQHCRALPRQAQSQLLHCKSCRPAAYRTDGVVSSLPLLACSPRISVAGYEQPVSSGAPAALLGKAFALSDWDNSCSSVRWMVDEKNGSMFTSLHVSMFVWTHTWITRRSSELLGESIHPSHIIGSNLEGIIKC